MDPMTSRRLRVLAPFLVAAFTVVSGALVLGQTTPPGHETTAASVASYPLAASMPVDPELAMGTLPNGMKLLRARERQTGASRRDAAGRARPARCSKTTTSRAWRTSSNTWQFEGTSHFPGQGIIEFLSSLGLTHRRGRERGDELRRHAVHAARADRRRLDVLDRALLVLEDWATARRSIRPAIDRERGIVLAEWRLHLGADERTEDKIRDVQLEGSRYADRSPIGSPDIIQNARARATHALLPRLVPPRSDGRDRRRRRRSRSHVVGDDQGALRVADRSDARTAAAGVRRAGTAAAPATPSSPTRRRRGRPSSSATCGRRATRDRSAAIAT